MKKRILITLLLLMCFLSLFMISDGITGYVTSDPGKSQLCSDEYPCEAPEICCLFYGEASGVCNTEDMCSEILEITKTGIESKEEMYARLYPEEEQVSTATYMIQFILGGFILVMLIFTIVMLSKPSAEVKKKVSKKSRN
jgi:hypothetical protein